MPDDLPVTSPQVRIGCGPISGFLEYVRWLATNDSVRDTPVTVEQLWAFYDEHIRGGMDPMEAAKTLALPISPDW